MGSIKDKARGLGNTGMGRLKQGLGRDLNDPSLLSEGRAQETKGGVQRAIGNAKDAIAGVFDRVSQIIRRSGD